MPTGRFEAPSRPAAAMRRPAPILPWPWLDRTGRVSWLKAAVLVAGALPAASLTGQWMAGALGAEPLKALLQGTGLWAIRLLLITLAVTPLRRVLDWQRVVVVRRMLGLAALDYALAHLLLYAADQGFSLGTVASEIARRFHLTIGFVALLGLAVLGWTSTDGWMRRLGRGWKRLHRLVFGIAVLGLLHFFLQSKMAAWEAVLAAGFFTWLLLWRALPASRQGSVTALLVLAPVSALGAALLEYAWYALATNLPAQRVLLANLDLGFGPRPAVWAGIAGLGLALAAALRRMLPVPRR